MKRLLSLMLALIMLFTLAACTGGGGGTSPTPTSSETEDEDNGETPDVGTPDDDGEEVDEGDEVVAAFEGKIAIVTNTISQNEEEYQSAQQAVEKYGSDKIVHEVMPDNFMTEQEQIVSLVGKLAADPEIKGIVINQAVTGFNTAIDKLKETRDDMFIVYCTPQENIPDVIERADLTIGADEIGMGERIVAQAKAMGATTIVHYSFPRHMAIANLSIRRDIMIEACEREGIEFVYAVATDPTSEAGPTGAHQFVLEDVPKKVAEYGADTAFFATNCAMQVPLITAVVEAGAIYPQPCCPSPYHGFPAALGIETGDTMGDIDYIISETRRILDEKGLAGRLSTWPVPVSMMTTSVGIDYIIEWINGNVTKEEIDVALLESLMSEYAGMEVKLTAYDELGDIYPTYQVCLMEYLTY